MSIQACFRLSRGAFRLDMDLSAQPGQVVGVLGPNGAGKSTLLRVLAGLERIDDGCIRIDGRLVDDGRAFVPARERQVGVVFQDYALFSHLSVLENVAFGPRARGAGIARSRQVASTTLERLGIADLAQRRPGEISGGQAQRVALARVLATSPTTLLLDEPLAALDILARQAVRIELSQQLANFAGSALLVTHDPIDAMLLADRILVLEDGSVTQEGSAAELARRPATAYVAALMGVNLLAGTARDGTINLDAGGTLRIADQELHGRALAVVRPESITLSPERPEGSARNAWPGAVAAIEAGHDRVRVHVDGRPSVVATITHSALADLHLRIGSPLWLSVKAMEVDAYYAPSR
jgi:molybdate transport system ATP-binding protein